MNSETRLTTREELGEEMEEGEERPTKRVAVEVAQPSIPWPMGSLSTHNSLDSLLEGVEGLSRLTPNSRVMAKLTASIYLRASTKQHNAIWYLPPVGMEPNAVEDGRITSFKFGTNTIPSGTYDQLSELVGSGFTRRTKLAGSWYYLCRMLATPGMLYGLQFKDSIPEDSPNYHHLLLCYEVFLDLATKAVEAAKRFAKNVLTFTRHCTAEQAQRLKSLFTQPNDFFVNLLTMQQELGGDASTSNVRKGLAGMSGSVLSVLTIVERISAVPMYLAAFPSKAQLVPFLGSLSIGLVAELPSVKDLRWSAGGIMVGKKLSEVGDNEFVSFLDRAATGDQLFTQFTTDPIVAVFPTGDHSTKLFRTAKGKGGSTMMVNGRTMSELQLVLVEAGPVKQCAKAMMAKMVNMPTVPAGLLTVSTTPLTSSVALVQFDA